MVKKAKRTKREELDAEFEDAPEQEEEGEWMDDPVGDLVRVKILRGYFPEEHVKALPGDLIDLPSEEANRLVELSAAELAE